jgi:TonB-linked SusC/RagA family outer membrane protein
MRLTAFLLFVLLTQVNASTSAQQVTVPGGKLKLTQLFRTIKQQTGYVVLFNKGVFSEQDTCNIKGGKLPLQHLLDLVIKDRPVSYYIEAKTIFFTRNVPALPSAQVLVADQLRYPVSGRITDSAGNPLGNATIINQKTKKTVSSAPGGSFAIDADEGDVLLISYVGYEKRSVIVTSSMLSSGNNLVVILKNTISKLEEITIASTGYQMLQKERSTGSFVIIDSPLLNRAVSTNLLERLDGIASGLSFDKRSAMAASISSRGSAGIRIRGESSVAELTQVSREPLIVLDNFPFEGNLDQINPNDVESVSILRDAAATSIWGVQAGNGVIVITTKKGRKNQPLRLEVNANTTFFNKPDLFYDQNWLPSKQYVEVERKLFEAGYFNADLSNTTMYPPLSPVVELLAQARDQGLSMEQAESRIAALANHDVRRDYLDYVYRKAFNQQYSIGLKGGSNTAMYAVSVGYDRNLSNQIGNDYNRFTLSSNNTYSPSKKIELFMGINYSINNTTTNNYQNGFGFMPVGGNYARLYPYARLADDNGDPLPIVKDYRAEYAAGAVSQGLLNWQYFPLNETRLADKRSTKRGILLRAGMKYKVRPFLNVEIQYQNERQQVRDWDYRSAETYYARNLINQFSILNANGTVTYQLPKRGILQLANGDWRSDNARLQLNFDRTFGSDHTVTAIAGAEARETRTEGFYRYSYGYDDYLGVSANNLNYTVPLPVNPAGTATIPAPPGDIYGNVNRFVSVYSNALYTFRGLYSLSLSGRRDGANIFGANTNNRFIPLWSAGAAWNISKEPFYHLNWLPVLKLRSSFGYSGNVYQGSVYTTGIYSTSSLTSAQRILNLTAPNPDLKWETVATTNVAIDFSFGKEALISGSIEWYRKKGSDLIERQILTPSAGFAQYSTNGASTQTSGLDITLNGRVSVGRLQWRPVLLLSTVKDKLTRFAIAQTAGSMRSETERPGLVGKPLYSLFSYKWAGLDPVNGDPVGMLNGQHSKDYAAILNNFNPDSLVFHGPARPPVFGAFRNDFLYGNWSLSINIVYRLGHYFRRPSTSLNYQDILSGHTHIDYSRSWKNPGDENSTQVPSLVYPSNDNRNTFYRFSEVLVERADLIRLQDIRLGYVLSTAVCRMLHLQSVQLYTYLSNPGVLWTANKRGIDPDITSISAPVDHNLPSPFSISVGLKLTL